MAHNLKPNTPYRLVTITVAVPASLLDASDAIVADGLNEMLRPGMLCNDAVFHDYELRLADAPLRTTDDAPEEGDLFTEDDAKPENPVYLLDDVQEQIDASKHQANQLSVRIVATGDYLAFNIDGYGLRDWEPGDGGVVMLENRDGVAVLVVYSDISDSNPTFEIDLSDAMESNRLPD